jgi:glycosyltransferase involved in cell wall biosynthesis
MMQMNILYVSGMCSDKKFKKIFDTSKIKPQQQAQKFNSLLSKGLTAADDNVCIMTALQINRSITDKIWFSSDEEFDQNIQYKYLPFINYPILRHICILISGFFTFITWALNERKEDKIVLCDILNLTSSVAALLASKLCSIKSIAIVTDIPNYMQNYTIQREFGIKYFALNLYRKMCNFFMHRYDSYIILTEEMNELVNPYNKPYVVIEGMVDINMKEMLNTLENKYEEKVVIYAGALYEKYGVKSLIEAFMKLEMDDVRLWLFGSGELENDIKAYEKENSRIKYFGVVSNELVVGEELKATLLVNPRPSNEEFTKYSFPSKNMEYMVSGTPILTTKLPGMPKEYYPHVYLIENETVDGICETLKLILLKNRDELQEKGQAAKDFVLKEKNNFIQAGKVLKMID